MIDTGGDAGIVGAVAIFCVGWIISVERRIAGLKALRRDVRRIDRRTMAVLLATDPAAARHELQHEQELDDEAEVL